MATIGGILLMAIGLGLLVGALLGLWAIDWLQKKIIDKFWRRSRRGLRDPFK